MVPRALASALLAAALTLPSCARRDGVVPPRAQLGGDEGTHDRPGASQDAELDRLLRAGWTAAGLEPAAYVDDATYVRRVSLDLTGRIPTATDLAAYEADPREDKRVAWVETLLSSQAFAEHWSELYTDLLLAGRTRERNRVTEDTRAWLEGAFADNMGYDAIATELLTATGRFEGVGPYGFLISHGEKNNVEALTGKTAKVFLGITLECAQCHDHPSDPRYSQEDFYALAAYFGRSRFRFQKAGGARVPTLTDRKRGQMHLPTPQDGPGDRSGAQIAPGFLSKGASEHPAGRRAALAQDITGSDLFAKTVVARTWQQLFGVGLVPRWDDLGGEHDESHPPILEHLASQFVRNGYDLHDLLRTLVLSDAYQRSSAAPDRDPAQTRAAEAVFAQHPVRSMNAEQLFRSLMIATSADGRGGPRFRKNFEKRRDRALKEYRFVFSDDEMHSTDSFSGSVPQALLLLNGDLIRSGTSDVQGTAVYDVLSRYESPQARVDALYLRVYGRRPTQAQQTRVLATLEEREHGSSAYEDLMHAMLLSSEFLTIH
ncbi:MAG: DUF1549 domain-containing protein [Nannocystales bacterium]